MHTFPLHRAVQADCHCCRIPTEFVFKSRSDHVICGGCLRHQRTMEPIIESMTKWQNDQIQLADPGVPESVEGDAADAMGVAELASHAGEVARFERCAPGRAEDVAGGMPGTAGAVAVQLL